MDDSKQVVCSTPVPEETYNEEGLSQVPASLTPATTPEPEEGVFEVSSDDYAPISVNKFLLIYRLFEYERKPKNKGPSACKLFAAVLLKLFFFQI